MKRPLAIWFWTVISLVVAVAQVVGVIATSMSLVTDWSTIGWVSWLPLAFVISLQLLWAFSFWKMSRLPVVIYLVGCAANLIAGFYGDVTWSERYPLLGPFVLIIIAGAFAITVLPHWKKMTWRPFGRRDTGPREPIENAFS